MSDIELTGEKRKAAIARLKSTPFERLELGKHLYKKDGSLKRGFTLSKIREIYLQFKKIICVSVRPSKAGRKYAFNYMMNKRDSYRLVFFLDKKPPCIFNCFHTGRRIEERLYNKYGFNR